MIRNAIICLLLTSFSAFAAESEKKLNVLWLVADDHAAYVTGCYGNALVRTPNLDRLASQGMRFDRAYCNSPICTASRQSFFTGLYPRTVGVTLLNTALPDSAVTLAEVFKGAGYETGAFGKMHFNSPLPHGFDDRADVPQYHIKMRMISQLITLPAGVEVQPPWKPFKDPAAIWLNSKALPVVNNERDMDATFFADHAIRFMRKKREKPFFMMVSFPQPHSPFTFPIEFRGKYDPAKMVVGRKGAQDDDQVPDAFRPLTEKEKQGIVAAYYTSTEFMDKQLGRVLDELEKSGQAENTIVVYCGDHGYSLGHHGRFEKHCSFEPAVRTPLLVRWPGKVKPGGATAALTELVDIAPTLLEACGVSVPPAMQGRSLVPLITGKTETHRDHVFITYAHNDEAMVCDGRWKLVYQRGKRVRDDGYDPKRPLTGPTFTLFDLESDPDEFVNLAGESGQADRVKKLTALLVADLKRTDRTPEKIPKTDDPAVLLDYLVQPNDVE